MNNDLISREALKKDFKSRLVDCNEWIEKAKDKETKILASSVKAFIYEVIMTIDNAPTVEPEKVLVANVTIDKDQLEQIVRDRVIEPINNGELVIKEERLHGEWQESENTLYTGGGYTKCSNCGMKYSWGGYLDVFEFAYCPTCGADMRPQENETKIDTL